MQKKNIVITFPLSLSITGHTSVMFYLAHLPSPPLDNIRVMVIVWRLRRNIVRTALCWVV